MPPHWANTHGGLVVQPRVGDATPPHSYKPLGLLATSFMPLLAFKAFIALNPNHRCKFFFGVLFLFLFFSMIVRHALLEVLSCFVRFPYL